MKTQYCQYKHTKVNRYRYTSLKIFVSIIQQAIDNSYLYMYIKKYNEKAEEILKCVTVTV